MTNDDVREELRQQLDSALRPEVERIISAAVRPYRVINDWLWVTVGVLLIVVILQWLP